MPIQDRIAHATSVAKWKVDQQTRLLKIQNEIHQLENDIKSQKARLADATLALYTQGRLEEDDLKRICATIDGFHKRISEKQSEQKATRQEKPPELQTAYTASYPSASSVSGDEPSSGLVCPQCGRSLIGRFCPEHGVGGVQKTPPQESPVEPQISTEAQRLMCPKCHSPLAGSFCPEHGVEGVTESA